MSAKATRFAILGWGLVWAFHYFIVSAGGIWPLPNYSAYYNRQADAFLRGQTHLVLKPAAGLLALPDPYDPVANRPYRKGLGVHDAILFEGKFYLYWGPVPGLIIAGLKSIGLAQHTIIGDEWLVLGFAWMTTFWVAMILRRLWATCFMDRSPAVIFLGLVIYGLSTPATYFLARPAVYEAAIIGGQGFLLAAIYLTWIALDPARKTPASSPRSRPSLLAACPVPTHHSKLDRSRVRTVLQLVLASVCFACAVGSRVSLALAVIAIGLYVCAKIVRGRWHSLDSGRWVFIQLLAFGLPLVISAILLAGYNYARFGQWLEFGQRFQLTGANYHAAPALFGVANFPPSVLSYLARPPTADGVFPFLHAQVGKDTFPDWISLPPRYESHETIVGLIWTVPLAALALVPLLRLRRRRDQDGGLLRSLVLLLAIGAGLGFLPILLMVGSTQRYLMDLWPTASILITIAFWQMPAQARAPLEPATGRHLAIGRLIPIGVGILVVWTIAVGVLLGFSGYFDHFRTWNPWLYERLGGEPAQALPPAADQPILH